MWSRRRRSPELRALMRGIPRFQYLFSKSQVAAALWDYDEEELADRALEMTDK